MDGQICDKCLCPLSLSCDCDLQAALAEAQRDISDLQNRIVVVEGERDRLRAALERIRGIDYRGNRHESHFIAAGRWRSMEGRSELQRL